MTIISRFLAKRYAQNLLLVLVIVSSIIFATSFIQDLAVATNSSDALRMSFSDFLEMFPLLLPITVFIATLLTFYRLTQTSELVIIRSSGLSTYKIMRPMLIVSAFMGILTATIVNPLSIKYNFEALHSSKIDKVDKAIFIRETSPDGSIVIRSSDIKIRKPNSIDFIDSTLVQENSNHQIINRVNTPLLTLENGIISTKSASILNSNGVESTNSFTIPTTLNKETIIKRYLKPNQVSFWELPGFIRTLHSMGAQTGMHVLQFLTLLFLPFVLVSMTTLGVLFSRTKNRRNFSFTKQFGFGILTCFIIYFIIQIFNAIGASGALSPLFAVFFPPAITLFFASAAISKSESM